MSMGSISSNLISSRICQWWCKDCTTSTWKPAASLGPTVYCWELKMSTTSLELRWCLLNLWNYFSYSIKTPSTNNSWLAIVCKYYFCNWVSSSARSLHVYIIILTILCRLKIVECKERQIYDIGFISPNTVNEWSVKKRAEETKKNLLKAFLRHQNKREILFPYNFKWVLLSCAYSVSLTRG